MAVEDKYVNTDLGSGTLLDSLANGGGKLLPIVITEEIAVADDDGSVYRLFRVNSNDIILSLEVSNDAITAGTDYDIGVYDIDSGAVVDKDAFTDGLDVSSAADKTNALTAPAIEDLVSEVWDIAGIQTAESTTADPQKQYDVAITANTVGSAAGTITVHALILKRG
jgi:hypothetical protein